MNLVEFISAELTRLHAMLDRSVAELTPEQWHAIPAGNAKANHIAFEMWHYVRTEDNIVRFILQDRRPTVWMEGGWAEKLGLPPVAQGTGMAAEDAQALRISDVAGFLQYRGQVWASTAEWLANPDATEFDKVITVKPLGEMPKIRALGQVCMTHGFTHLGELELIRTLLGLPPAISV
ncbi:MAG TPA: DinB family protein [Dehalococcoidia bacterium]|nr:DinB family protein [Dehalococcoidia bacterium]